MQHISVPQHLAIANALYANLAYTKHVILDKNTTPQNGTHVFELLEKGPQFSSLSEVNEHELSAFIKKHLDKKDIYFSAVKLPRSILFCALHRV